MAGMIVRGPAPGSQRPTPTPTPTPQPEPQDGGEQGITDIESFNAFLRTKPSPEARTDALIALRGAMEAGDVLVNDYLKAGKKVGKLLAADFRALPNSPRGSALANQFQGGTGFLFIGDANQGNVEIQTHEFSDDFQKRFREEILPDNLTPEQREEFLNDIPFDIPIESDRFAAEREGIRQRLQTEEAQEEAATERETGLSDLADLLTEFRGRQFKSDIPILAESAQARGQLDSSGFGNELARRQAQLASQSEQILGMQGLSDRDAEILGQLKATEGMLGFQTAGLQRQFGLDDQQANFIRQLQIANLTQPDLGGGGGKSGGQGAAQGALAGAAIGTQINPGLGTAIGAGGGALAGILV